MEMKKARVRITRKSNKVSQLTTCKQKKQTNTNTLTHSSEETGDCCWWVKETWDHWIAARPTRNRKENPSATHRELAEKRN